MRLFLALLLACLLCCSETSDLPVPDDGGPDDGGTSSIVVTTEPGEFVHAALPDGQVLLGMGPDDNFGRGRFGLQAVFLGDDIDQVLLSSGPEVTFDHPDGGEFPAGGEAGMESTAMWSVAMDGGDFAAPVGGVAVADSLGIESHTTLGWVLGGPPWAFWQRLETTVSADSVDITWGVAVMAPDFVARHELALRGIFDVLHLRNDDVLLAEATCDHLVGETHLNVNELVGWRHGHRVHVVYDSAEALAVEWGTDCRVTLRHEQPGEAVYTGNLAGSATIHLIPE